MDWFLVSVIRHKLDKYYWHKAGWKRRLFCHGRQHFTFCIQLFPDPADILSLASCGIKLSASPPHILEHASLQADWAWGFCAVCSTSVSAVGWGWGWEGEWGKREVSTALNWSEKILLKLRLRNLRYWDFGHSGMLRQMRTSTFSIIQSENTSKFTLLCNDTSCCSRTLTLTLATVKLEK